MFSVRCFYRFLIFRGCKCPFALRIWKVKVPQKFKIHMWVVIKERILTRDLLSRGMDVSDNCILYNRATESAKHIFLASLCEGGV